ncbi:MAG: haloacid dehalogenase-like hydrolase [Lachnospiraceae bacterium]|nr:haloacid dehalogenase-like hydrolase [Lachnospiraceae bacterium]
MNVYDFDGTIFDGDCSIGFAFFCMNHHPTMWITFFPKALTNLILYKIGKRNRATMMRKHFVFLNKDNLPDFDRLIKKYWKKNIKKIPKWYLKQRKKDDLIISASPTCIIGPIAKKLGVNYVATEYDREFGVLVDNMMFAKGKSRYMIDHGFPVIENFYSDSLTDTPIALCAEKAHLVTNHAQTVEDWPHLDKETMRTVKKKINYGWNIHL